METPNTPAIRTQVVPAYRLCAGAFIVDATHGLLHVSYTTHDGHFIGTSGGKKVEIGTHGDRGFLVSNVITEHVSHLNLCEGMRIITNFHVPEKEITIADYRRPEADGTPTIFKVLGVSNGMVRLQNELDGTEHTFRNLVGHWTLPAKGVGEGQVLEQVLP